MKTHLLTDSDLVGRVQIPVAELMKTPNKMIRREDSLRGFEDANDMPGKISWSIGYFQKAPLEKELERAPTAEEAKAAPQPSKTPPEMEMLPSDAAPNPAKKDLPPPAPNVEKTKPNPKWPSGVLSVILHQVSLLCTRCLQQLTNRSTTLNDKTCPEQAVNEKEKLVRIPMSHPNNPTTCHLVMENSSSTTRWSTRLESSSTLPTPTLKLDTRCLFEISQTLLFELLSEIVDYERPILLWVLSVLGLVKFSPRLALLPRLMPLLKVSDLESESSATHDGSLTDK
jgi:hypothetical protein